MSVSVPLRALERPVELTAEHTRRIAEEFYVCYLDKLGVTPTPASLAQVKKLLPFDACKITCSWRSRGATVDSVVVSPADAPNAAESSTAPTSSYRPPAAARRRRVANALRLLPSAGAAAAGGGSHDERALGAVSVSPTIPRGLLPLQEAVRRFLYPFKREPAAEALSAPCTDFGARDAHRYGHFSHDEVQADVGNELVVRTKLIRALQDSFVRDFPWRRLEARVGAAMVRLGRENLSDARTTRFVGLLVLLLYWTHIAPLSGRSIEPSRLTALLSAVQHHFSERRAQLKAKRSSLLFVLPALLLLVRVLVEALLRQHFPRWWSTVSGEKTLVAVDDSIERLLDPNGYLTHFAALRNLSGWAPHGTARDKPRSSRENRARNFATSTYVRDALPESTFFMSRTGLEPRDDGLRRVASAFDDSTRRRFYGTAISRIESAGPDACETVRKERVRHDEMTPELSLFVK